MPKTQIKTIFVINVKGINSAKHFTNEYVMINIYVFGITQNKNAKTYMQREIHLFDYLKIKILMGMNILKPKKINIDIDIKKLIIRNCNGLVVPIQITIKDNVYVKRTIRNDK